jgi:hypothetical protein
MVLQTFLLCINPPSILIGGLANALLIRRARRPPLGGRRNRPFLRHVITTP